MGDLNDVEYGHAGTTADGVTLLYCLRCGALILDLADIRQDHDTWHEQIEQPANTALLVEVESLRRTNNDLRDEIGRYRAGVEPRALTVEGTERSPGQLWAQLLDMGRDTRLGVLGTLIAANRNAIACVMQDHNGTLQRLRDDLETAQRHNKMLGETNEVVTRELNALKARTGPYVWRPGDPPPPAYVKVLHDSTDNDGHATYLCRAIDNPDLWGWRPYPDRAFHTGDTDLTWSVQAQGAAGPLTEVPGGNL